MAVKALSSKKLRLVCNPDKLPFKTTAELKKPKHPLGQDRALEAVDFGVNIAADRYNIFCLGQQGTGKYSLVKQYLKKEAAKRPTANDWCYVNNFDEPRNPKALKLPAGKALPFKKDMDDMIEELNVVLADLFEGEEYHNSRQVIDEKYKDQKSEFFNSLQQKATGKNVALLRMPVGMVVAPMKNGEVLSPEAFEELPEDEKHELLAELSKVERELEDAVQGVPKWEKLKREEIKTLNKDVTYFSVKGMIGALKKKYKDIPSIIKHLKVVQHDIVENVDDFLEDEELDPHGLAAAAAAAASSGQSTEDMFARYRVNVIVSHKENSGAPIIFEDNPTQHNLIGNIERSQHMGALVTDFSLINAGAIHKANGGFLIIEARKLFMHPYVWESLKRALRSKQIKLERQSRESSVFSTISIDPEPIPLNVKIVLLGEPDFYYMLSANDPDFKELFKVEADFNYEMDRTKKNEHGLAAIIADFVKKEKLRNLNSHAVARIIEYSSRQADDTEKLSSHISLITNLVRESHYYARLSKSNIIGRTHVIQAIEAQLYRSSRIRDSIHEEIIRGNVMIPTSGEVIGQINGLVVLSFGRVCFGKPSRITCQVRIGKGDVVNIEREVHLSGPLHSKGVLILSSFLSTRFATNTPLSLEASLVFEQSYGGIDGDSASSTELYAMLSALAEAPIKQSLAVTGSVDQFGRVQPIGGVNEKIEGFFDICKERGLTGEHGVLIPKSNVKNLMLRHDIVEASENGLFHVYPIETIDEGIEILTGIPAGELDEEGKYPVGSINRRVASKLNTFFRKTMAIHSQSEGYGKGRK